VPAAIGGSHGRIDKPGIKTHASSPSGRWRKRAPATMANGSDVTVTATGVLVPGRGVATVCSTASDPCAFTQRCAAANGPAKMGVARDGV
jgi:hypothetical protein